MKKNMNMKKSVKNLFVLIMMMGIAVSCTDLDSELYSELTPETEYTTTDNYLAALLTAYNPLVSNFADDGYWELQEHSAETAVAPAKFGPWNDGGIWARLHRHQWENSAFFINNAWNACFSGVATCNQIIEQFESAMETTSVDLTTEISELRALRALYVYLAMDIFGDIPIVTSFNDAPANPSQSPRAEVYSFIESELLELIPLLSEDNGGEMYSRMNVWSARALLARLYLNAEVYTGTPQWQKAADMAQTIIDGGIYSLELDYHENFAWENQSSIENILVSQNSVASGPDFRMHLRTLHPLSRETYDINAGTGPWNGYTAMEDFYNSFDDEDTRKEIFIVGQQYSRDGEPLMDEAAASQVDSEGNPEPDGPPLIFTPHINELIPNAFGQAGARIGKYEFIIGMQMAMENDFPIFRYSEVLLIRAEALWRMNNADAEAVELIRQVRERAGLSGIDPISEDDLYTEIQRELAFEAQARTIMIRFDKFNEAWWEKDASDPNKKLFPIPTNQLNGNPNLVQNPGY